MRKRMPVPRLVALCAAMLAAACAPRADPNSLRAVDPVIEALCAPNRLDHALAAAPRGWRFSALFSVSDKRIPLLILVRAARSPAARAPRTGQAPQDPAGLEAVLLTETGMSLCSLAVTADEAAVRTSLPDSRITALCERTGTALQRLVLSPRPDGRDRLLRGTESAAEALLDPTDRAPRTALWREQGWDKLGFFFTPDGPLREKRAVRGDALQWKAQYADHARDGGLYIPRNWRYAEGFWNIRLALLPPDPAADGTADGDAHGQNNR